MDSRWQSSKLDLVLSASIAFLFPFVAGILYDKIGALIPMVLYYALAWGIVKWRRGTTGYIFKIAQKPPFVFYVNLILIFFSVLFAFFARVEFDNPDLVGVLITAFVWAPINAASEQLLWIYIFESWDQYDKFTQISQSEKRKISLKRIIGLLLFSFYVGLIHIVFWVKFLHTVDPDSPFGIIFILFTSITGYMHILVWRRSNNMIWTFIPHFILNFIPTVFTGYSIIGYLIK